MNKLLAIAVIVLAAIVTVWIGAYTGVLFGKPPIIPGNNTNPDIKTFQVVNGSVETVDGKPVIRLFSTTWCPHCQWIASTYDRVAKEYADAGKIVAYHWELDTNDDTLTPEVEGSVPASEQAVFQKFNPNQSIPTFVFGGKYWRIGNGYEREDSLDLEEQEFRAVIEELIKEAQTA
ncbi:MAG TPA: thioredoxin family protein [archaeon]|nr:thioredoxin family protein [archaeon]